MKSYVLKSFILTVTLLFIAAGVQANNLDVAAAKGVNQRAIAAIANNLSQKLRADLGDSSIKVKISEIEKHRLIKNTADIAGLALAVVESENNQLPVHFEAKINARTFAVDEINYNFVDESAEFAPTSTEEVLMKELMKQVSNDYKTDSITISIDGFEIIEAAGGREYKGVGEIKIDEMQWSKINFDVLLDPANKASKIKYDIK